jgi:acyl-CoA thioester hydrolase
VARFVYPCPLRWSDMDAYGHINNVSFVRYLEDARIAVFFAAAKEANLTSFEGQLVVVRHEIDYEQPLVYRPEPVLVELWVSEIRNSSFTVNYEIRDDEARYATARSVLAAYNPSAGRARRLSPEERQWLERYRE